MSTLPVKPTSLDEITADNLPAVRPQFPADRSRSHEEYLPFEVLPSAEDQRIMNTSKAMDAVIVVLPYAIGGAGIVGIVAFCLWLGSLLWKAAAIAAGLTYLVYLANSPRRRVTRYDSPPTPPMPSSPSQGVNIFVNQTGTGNQSNINVNL